jgi:hypothetical protein
MLEQKLSITAECLDLAVEPADGGGTSESSPRGRHTNGSSP